MHRRDFMLRTAVSLTVAGLAIGGCTTTGTTKSDQGTEADKRRREIDASVDSTLARLYSMAQGSRELTNKATGVLTFPSVFAAGFIVGGEYGEGALRTRAQPAAYYSLASVSAGLQIGAQSKAIIFLFMTQDALDQFRKSSGWSVGVDASVSVVKVGANGVVDLTSANNPVLAFVLTNAGLMANLSLEGTKISPLKI